ncbi:MAG: nitroreductase [Planctomycetota bacterium]|nr:nitroreductase [Planctomycetota bacterium]
MNMFDLIRDRRTHKVFTGEPVTNEQLERLLELATWAPNHRMTEPWRFFVVGSEQVETFAQVVVEAIGEEAPPKMQAKRTMLSRRLPRLGAFVSVARRRLEDAHRDQEDYGACCCAVQNLLLAATAMGLGSFWSTGGVFDLPPVRDYLGMGSDLERVASIWLGTPAEEARSVRRPATEWTHWVGRD